MNDFRPGAIVLKRMLNLAAITAMLCIIDVASALAQGTPFTSNPVPGSARPPAARPWVGSLPGSKYAVFGPILGLDGPGGGE